MELRYQAFVGAASVAGEGGGGGVGGLELRYQAFVGAASVAGEGGGGGGCRRLRAAVPGIHGYCQERETEWCGITCDTPSFQQ